MSEVRFDDLVDQSPNHTSSEVRNAYDDGRHTRNLTFTPILSKPSSMQMLDKLLAGEVLEQLAKSVAMVRGYFDRSPFVDGHFDRDIYDWNNARLEEYVRAFVAGWNHAASVVGFRNDIVRGFDPSAR